MAGGDDRDLWKVVAGGEPPDLLSSYLATFEEGATKILGTSLPAIGVRYEQTASGIWVPEGAGRPTISNLARPYITAAEVLDEVVGPADVVDLITRHTKENAVAAAATLMADLLEDHPMRQGVQEGLVERFTYGDTKQRAMALVRDGWIFLAPQGVLAVLKLALMLPCRGMADPDTALPNVVGAVLGLSQFLGQHDPQGDSKWFDLVETSLAVEMVQNQHFNNNSPIGISIGRFRRLRELEAEHFPEEAREFDLYFEQQTGCSIDALFEVGLTIRMLANDTRTIRIARGQLAQLDLLEGVIDAALRLLAADEADFEQDLKVELERVGFDWAYNQLRRFPMLRCPDDTYLVLHWGFFMERICGAAAFWETRFRLGQYARRGGPDERRRVGRFEGHHGHIPEPYVEESLRLMVGGGEFPGPVIYREQELIERWGAGPVPDLMIDFGTTVLLIEVVSHRLKEGAVGGGVLDDLNDDLRIIVEEKGEQLDGVVHHLLGDAEFIERNPPIGIIPVILVATGFPWSPVTAAAAWAGLKELGHLQQPQVNRVQVMDLSDLEWIEAAVIHGDLGLLELFERRITNDEDNLPLDVWIRGEGVDLSVPPRLGPAIERSFRQIAERLGMDPEKIESHDWSRPKGPR